MKIGYARTSTIEQEAGLEAQIRELEAAGCERIYQERVSSIAQRQELNTALAYVREGDVLMVTKLDRLARSMKNFADITDQLQRKNVHLNILNLGMDTSTPTGKLILNVLGSVAQFEREIMLERQREGIAKAKQQGKFKGRKPTAKNQADVVLQMAAEGKKPLDIAKAIPLSKSSVYRILGAAPSGDVSEPITKRA